MLGILLASLVNLRGEVLGVDTTQEGLLRVELETQEGKRWFVLGPAGWMAEKGFELHRGDVITVAAEGELATSVSKENPDGSVFVLPLRGGENLELELWKAKEGAEGGAESNLK